MVCPYCNTRAVPNSTVCNHCGVILKNAKSLKKAAKPFPWRRFLLRGIGYVVAGLLVAYLAHLSARFLFENKPAYYAVAAAVAGLLVGVLLMYVVSTGGYLLRSTKLNGQRRRVQGEINKIEQEHEKKRQGDAHSKGGKRDGATDEGGEIDPETRMELAALHLIEGQVDESLQQFQQMHKLGLGTRVDFLNNCGVAFAKRGQMQLSLERFQQAIRVDPKASAPRVNMIYSLMQTGDKERIGRVLADQNGALAGAVDSEPFIANRVGLTYALSGKPADAQQVIEKHARKGDRELQADTRNDLGITKALGGGYREALADFAEALRLDPGHAPAMANTGAVYYHQKRYDDAAERLEASVLVDPHNGLAHSLLGAVYCRLNLHNDGIREFREARLHEMRLFEPNYNLGKVYIEQDVLEQAERYLARAFEINPYSWQTLVAQAVLLFKQNMIERATAVYRQALAVRPDETSVLGGLGLCATIEGDYTLGENYFRRAIEIDADDADLLTNFAWHYLLRSDVKNATEILEKSMAKDRRGAVANNNMGLCQMDMGAYDAAQQYFKAALQIDPNLGTVYYNIGNDYIAQKAMENAIPAWETAKKHETGNADLHTNLGVGYYKKEDFEKASVEFRRVLHLRQENSSDYANLGLTFARMKRHKDAIEQFELGLQIDPNNPMLHSNLGLACYFANRVEDAMREWQVVTTVNKQYAQARAKKQQSEYDDTTIDFVPLYISERALYTPPKVPDYAVTYVPGYGTSRWELIVADESVKKLEALTSQRHKVDRSIRALRL